MFEIKVGLNLQSIKEIEKIGEINSVVNNKASLKMVDGTYQDLTFSTIKRWWKPVERTVTIETTERSEQVSELFLGLETIYKALLKHFEGVEGIICKVNTNGTTAIKLDGKGNFAEIRLQKKRLVMRVLHQVNPANGFEIKVIPESYGWTYKNEINIRTSDDVAKLIAELDLSKWAKAR